MWHRAWISWLLLKQPIHTGSFSVFSISTHMLWINICQKTPPDAHLPAQAITSALRLMGRHVGPGDDHGVRGADLVVLGESPVHVLGRPAQNFGAGVLAEEDFANSVAGVQVSLQDRNHAELWRHLAKIGGLAGRLCCRNKTVCVDLKLKTEAEATRRARNEIILSLTTVEESGPVPADPLWFFFFFFTFQLIRLMIQVSVCTLLKQEQNKRTNAVFTHFSVHTHTHTLPHILTTGKQEHYSWPGLRCFLTGGPRVPVDWACSS